MEVPMQSAIEEIILINQKATMRMVGVGSRETLARWIRKGLFPLPIKIGCGQLRWIKAEIEAWIRKRMNDRLPAASSGTPVRPARHAPLDNRQGSLLDV